MNGILYVVATPIGNLEDISLRALRILGKIEFAACEDTRHTGLLYKNLKVRFPDLISQDAKPTLLSYFEGNEIQRIPQILNVLKNGVDVALVSDAGTPTISDPGFKLIRECIRQGIKIESIPGPSSVISALVTSGLPTDKFLFLGYPPRKPGHRKSFFENISTANTFIKSTIILFEAPHKLLKTLMEMKEIFGDIEIVVARELTKVHEEIRREQISESINHFSKTNPKGELVLLFNIQNGSTF